MKHSAGLECLARLLALCQRGAAQTSHDLRHAIDRALACDPRIHCQQRLECAWMTAKLADHLGALAISGR